MHKPTQGEIRGMLRISLAAIVCAGMLLAMVTMQGCATRSTNVFRDPNMDFGSVRTVAVMPFANFGKDAQGSDRVRDVFITALMATGSIYVIPTGEMWRGITGASMANPTTPAVAEVVRLCRSLSADAVITGNIREYGEVRAASTSADVISMSLQLIEGQTGKVVWSASTTYGGVGVKDRLLGGGGQPMNDITEKAIHDLINKLFD